MEYSSIQTKKIYEQIFDIIHQRIQEGSLKPGDKLPSSWQLAEQFQVGRSAVREALSALRARGLIEVRQGEGTFVKAPEPAAAAMPLHQMLLMKHQDLMDLLEVRKVLEVGVVRGAALRRTDADLAVMKAWLDEGQQHLGDEKASEWADLQFHMAMAKAAHNNTLLELMNRVLEAVHETRRVALHGERATAEDLVQQHQDIFAAIARQDVQGAEEALLRHLEGVKRVLDHFSKELS
ncbi:FadR/GntR family transcriptional regulator [Ectobacillus ponti]|uniref:FadR family transcriptional regulator n=1 Tax=Ectobacillus ponti TaxID=2961894 RepID=A0AA42BTE8_9BACI|nr:FadR/GntR family transcriptional regulator [Ectobacillus ponti]MCP8969403.1 FadR family transcriptional regulator [Ectobacillus ponti]